MPISIFIMQMEQKIRSHTRRQAVVVSQQPKSSLHRLNSNEIHRDNFFFLFFFRLSFSIHRWHGFILFAYIFSIICHLCRFYFILMSICVGWPASECESRKGQVTSKASGMYMNSYTCTVATMLASIQLVRK